MSTKHASYTVTRTVDYDDYGRDYPFLAVDPCSFMSKPPVPHSQSSSSVSSAGSASTTTAPRTPSTGVGAPLQQAPPKSSGASMRSYSPSVHGQQQQQHVPPSVHPYYAAGQQFAPSTPGAGPSSPPVIVYSALRRVDNNVRTIPPRRPLPSTPLPASPTSTVESDGPSSSRPPPLPPLPHTPTTAARYNMALPPTPKTPTSEVAVHHVRESTNGSQQVTVTLTHHPQHAYAKPSVPHAYSYASSTHGGERLGLAPRASVAESVSSKGTCESTLLESPTLTNVLAANDAARKLAESEEDPYRPDTPTTTTGSRGSAASVHGGNLPREASPFRPDRPWLKRVFHKPSAADIASLVLQGWPESDVKQALALCQTTDKAIEYLTLQRTKDYSIATLIQDGYKPKAARDAVDKYPNADVANAYLMHQEHCDLSRFKPVKDCMWCDAIVVCRRGIGNGADSRILGAGMGAPMGYGFTY